MNDDIRKYSMWTESVEQQSCLKALMESFDPPISLISFTVKYISIRQEQYSTAGNRVIRQRVPIDMPRNRHDWFFVHSSIIRKMCFSNLFELGCGLFLINFMLTESCDALPWRVENDALGCFGAKLYQCPSEIYPIDWESRVEKYSN